MTHSSYANEHHGTHLQCNERLEFLGDSVLGFVTAGYLFTHYPRPEKGPRATPPSCRSVRQSSATVLGRS